MSAINRGPFFRVGTRFAFILYMFKSVVLPLKCKLPQLLAYVNVALVALMPLLGTSALASEEPSVGLKSVPPETTLQVPVSDLMVDGSTATLTSNSTTTEIDKGIVSFATHDFSKEDILNDRANRIPESFHISSTFSKRVAFWFDVYTRYGSNVHLLHDSDHPWIVYGIVDTSSILALPVKTHNKVTPFIRANAFVKTEKLELVKVLRTLIKKSKKKSSVLTTEEQRIAGLLEELPGKRNKVYLAAIRGLRSQIGQRDFFKSGVINSAKYLSRMEETFARYDLPIELTRIPLVESSFNENAVSKVGASGIWQFMPHIGKHFLYMDYAIDERNSPLKATEAAAQLLLEDFRIFKSWPLAITAYNHGSGGVRHAMRQLGTDDLETIVDKYHNRSFQFASSNYYASFLGALHAERYEKEIFGPLKKVDPIASDTIQLAYRMKAANIVKVAGMTMEELRLYNPDLKIRSKTGNFFLHKGYALHLPEGRGSRIELFHLQAQDYMDKKSGRKKRSSLRAESADNSASAKTNKL